MNCAHKSLYNDPSGIEMLIFLTKFSSIHTSLKMYFTISYAETHTYFTFNKTNLVRLFSMYIPDIKSGKLL